MRGNQIIFINNDDHEMNAVDEVGNRMPIRDIVTIFTTTIDNDGRDQIHADIWGPGLKITNREECSIGIA